MLSIQEEEEEPRNIHNNNSDQISSPNSKRGEDNNKSVIVYKRSAVFKFHGRSNVYDKKSLYLFYAKSSFRKAIVWIADWRYFEYFILVTILLNSIVLAVYDYHDRDSLTTRNRILDIAGLVSTVIFTVECIIKIIAFGFIVHRRAYLRSGWNLIDFTVVMTGMKKNVNALISAIPDFINVVLFLGFVFILFAIFGVSQYSGVFYNACRVNPRPENATHWQKDLSISRVCSSSGSGLFTCPSSQTCGNPITYGISLENDYVYDNPDVFYGINGFDNLGQSILTVFQIISTDDWNYFLSAMMDADIPVLGFIYCFIMIVIGTFFLMNLILAVIIQAFIKIQKNEIDQELAKLDDENSKMLQQEMGNNEDPENNKFQTQQQQIPSITISSIEDNKKNVRLDTIQESEEIKQQDQTEAQNLATSYEQLDSRQRFFGNDEEIKIDNKHKVVSLKSSLIKNTAFKRMQTKNNHASSLAIQDLNHSTNLDDSSVNMVSQASILPSQSQDHNIGASQESLDLSFLKQITTKRKVVNVFTNQLKESKTIRERASLSQSSISSENQSSIELKGDDTPSRAEQQNTSQFANMLTEIRKLKKSQESQSDENKEENDQEESNIITKAFNNFIEKKKKDLVSQDEYFNDLFKEARQTYSTNKERRRSSTLRQLTSIKLGIRLQRKSHDLSKEYKKLHTEFRAETKFIYRIALSTVNNRLFKIFMTSCIISNTIVLSLDRYPMDETQQYILDWLNLVFTVLFTIEMLIKLTGYGIKTYFNDAFNLFDCVIVLSSIVDLFVTYLSSNSSGGAITAFRAFRLLRIFMLAKSWKQLQNLLKTIAKTLKDVSTFSVLLFLFMFIFSLLGMELFAFQVRFDQDGNLNLTNGTDVASNFNDPLSAFTTVFIVLTGDEWTEIYFNHSRAAGGAIASLYFLSLIVIGQKILLNLFLAILLENFDEDSLDQELKEKFKDIKQLDESDIKLSKIEKLLRWIKSLIYEFFNLEINISDAAEIRKRRSTIATNPSLTRTIRIQNQSIDSSNKQDSQRQTTLKSLNIDNDLYIDGKSLMLFSMDSKARQKCFDIVTHKYFDYFIIFIIIASAVHLALDNPLNDPVGNMQKALDIIDIATTIIFGLECLMKIFTFGFILNGKTSYLRNPWNMLDFFIIVLSIISLSPLPSELKIFKALRVVRPLRLISRNKGLKVAVKALAQAIPNIINVSVITMLFFLIFGIIGISYFKGKFYSCHIDQNQPGAKSIDIITKWDCLNVGGLWKAKPYGFDNIFQAIQTLFQMATTTGWAAIMFTSMSATDIDQELIENSNPYWSLFFILFIIVGSFFLLNLFVGVVISNFNREKDKIGGNNLLTDRQKEWIDIRLLVINSKPVKKLKPPSSKIRKISFVIQDHRYFDRLILVCILMNTIVLTLRWYDQQNFITQTTDILNYIFSAVFTLEAIIKILAQGNLYFKDGWNIFDFAVVVSSIISIFLTAFTSVQLGASTTIVRAFRILRVIRLIKRAQSLRLVFNTFIVTLPALVNVGGLLLLLLYLYSVLGVFLFSEVKRNGMMNDVINFESFFNAFITLFIIATGDSWDQIVSSTTKAYSPDYQCLENAEYIDYKNNMFITNGCGPYFPALAYYYSYILLVNLIFLNLFIAIILQGFEDTQRRENRLFNYDSLQHFRKVWSDFDPEATTFIKIPELKTFLFQLGDPLGWDKSFDGSKMQQDRYIINLNLPTYNDFSDYQFLDVLDALSLRLLVKESFERKKKEEDNMISDKNLGDNINPLMQSLTQQEEEFKKSMIQDINKLKFQEDAQKIDAVKQVQIQENKVESQQNFKKDYLTSLHLAAADVTFNHMKFVVAKRKLMRKIQEVDTNNTGAVEVEEQQEQQSYVNQIKQNQPMMRQIPKITTQPLLNQQLTLQFHHHQINNDNDDMVFNQSSRSESDVVFSPYKSLSQTSIDQDRQIDRMIEEEIILNTRSNEQQLRSTFQHVLNNHALHNEEAKQNLFQEGSSQLNNGRRNSRFRSKTKQFEVTMGGTGEQAMMSEEEKESITYLDIPEETTFRNPLRAHNQVSHQSSDISNHIQDELSRMLNIPHNQKYLDMLENAEDDIQYQTIRNDLAQNTDFMDQITKVIDGVVEKHSPTPANKRLQIQPTFGSASLVIEEELINQNNNENNNRTISSIQISQF